MRSLARLALTTTVLIGLLALSATGDYWFRDRGEQIQSMARMAPADVRSFLAFDVTLKYSPVRIAGEARSWLGLADGDAEMAKVESFLGHSLETILGWFALRGFVVVLPAQAGSELPAEVLGGLEVTNRPAVDQLLGRLVSEAGLPVSAAAPGIGRIGEGRESVAYGFHQEFLLVASSPEVLRLPATACG